MIKLLFGALDYVPPPSAVAHGQASMASGTISLVKLKSFPRDLELPMDPGR